MNKLSILLHFIFLIFVVDVRAQALQDSDKPGNFKPSVALVTGFLTASLFLTFLLLLYAKFCHRGSTRAENASDLIVEGLFRLRPSIFGVDKRVIESLPLFTFSSIKGSREGLECAVCLSKFEDVEILRLLPKCQHAFHVGCIDKWLERHKTCPLCRRKVTARDVSELQCSVNQRSGEVRDESSLELYVQREENDLASSRFSTGRSFRLWSQGDARGGELLAQRSVDSDQSNRRFHRFNHRVLGYSDVVFKNRWSNVSSSDLVFLNSQFLNHASNARFMSAESTEIEEIQKDDEQRIGTINQAGQSFLNFPGLPTTSDLSTNLELGSNFPYPTDWRSMSEIVVHPNFLEFEDNTESSLIENSESERIRRLWISIVRKTAQWITNRESRLPNSQGQ